MPIKQIIIKGSKQTFDDTSTADDLIELKESYSLDFTTRGISDSHLVNLKDNNLVEIVFEDGTTWLSAPDALDEVFPGATLATRSATGTFEIPAVLHAETSERGVFSNILVKVVNIFSKKVVNKTIVKIAADLERKQLENHSGLYRLDNNFGLEKFNGDTSPAPYLLFLHGTNSSTKGSLLQKQKWH